MTFVENGIYFVRGIVSVGANEDNGSSGILCDSTQYAIFTDVAQYLPWIEEVVDMSRAANVAEGCEINIGCKRKYL